MGNGDAFTAAKFDWLETVARDADLRHSAVRVAVVLSSYFNREHGFAWPSVERLGKDTGLTRRAIQTALNELVERGHLDREIGGGRATPSRYRPTTKQRTGVHGNADKGRTGVRLNGAESAHVRSEKQRTSVRPNPLSEPTEGDSYESLSDRFAEFWQHYPRKVGRKGAEKAFAKAVKDGTSPADLIAGAMRYAAEREGDDPRYTKHPATWLNAGCWEDEPVPQGATGTTRADERFARLVQRLAPEGEAERDLSPRERRAVREDQDFRAFAKDLDREFGPNAGDPGRGGKRGGGVALSRCAGCRP